MSKTKKRPRQNLDTNDQEFLELLKKKENLEKDLDSLEKQIYALESSYIESTTKIGDLIRGWGSSSKNKNEIDDRIFSSSSVTSKRV